MLVSIIMPYFKKKKYVKYSVLSVLNQTFKNFELAFSMLSKLNINFSPSRPDTRHLHQLIYNLIKNKFSFSKLKSNNISSIIILLFNSLSMFLGSIDIYNTQNQIILIIVNIIFYSAIYK